MERTNRLALALGVPLTLAAVLGGVAFAAGNSGDAGGGSGATSLFQEGTPTTTPGSGASPTPGTNGTPDTDDDGTTPDTDGSRSGCPNKNGSGSGSDTTTPDSSTSTNLTFRRGH